MWMDADSDEKGQVDEYGAECEYESEYEEQWDLREDRAYWRRRFLILCGGVAALGACAWLFPGAHQPSKREAAAERASVAALDKRQALPSSAFGASWQGGTMPDAYPTASAGVASPVMKPRPAKAKRPGTAYHPQPTPAARLAASAASTCVPADIVLSLFTSQLTYAKGAHPSFSVYAVSTAAASCALAYGAGSVQLVVTRHGQVVWDSNTCRPAPASRVRFTQGVPQVLTMTWNPAATHPAGCAGSLPAGASGTLDAVALSHGQSSPVRTFELSQ
jgi:hypothetical protein